jgi:acetyl-CoA C-acetyltransferase
MTDEGPRRDTTLGKMAQLPPLRAGWELTAATASQISDGSAAVLIASSAAVRRHGFTPRARIRALAVTGSDPVYMLTGPIPATEKALEKGHLSVDDIDVFEVNEAFAPVVIAWPGTPGPRWPRPTRMAAPSRLAIRWGPPASS